MKFYINNKELSEKVFWRTLESLVSPMQRVHILDGMKVKIADYLCWIEIRVMLLKVNMTDEIVNQVIYYFSLFICRINTKLTELIHLVYFLI